MKTRFAVAAMKATADPGKMSVIHVCLYENPPQQNDIDSLADELRTDETFGLTHLVLDRDYSLYELDADTLRVIKQELELPDEL